MSSTTQEDCSLDCLNGGNCAFRSTVLGDSSNPATAVCECPSGFSGLLCEIAFETCGQNEHPCYNGATCVKEVDPDTNEDLSYCDCSSAVSIHNQVYAGHFCQHESTVFCMTSQEENTPRRHTFCANGGHCKQVIHPDEAHQGCHCPKEWKGQHCQYRARNYDVNQTADRRMQTIEWVLYAIVIAVTLLLATCLCQALMERRREHNKKELEEKARTQNLAAGALTDIDLAFNPYDCDRDQAVNQRQPLRLW